MASSPHIRPAPCRAGATTRIEIRKDSFRARPEAELGPEAVTRRTRRDLWIGTGKEAREREQQPTMAAANGPMPAGYNRDGKVKKKDCND